MTFEQYVKEHLGDFFLTGKKDYNMQVGIADKEQTFHNPLEDADYTVKPGDIILKGTVGEMRTTKLEKALKTYKMPDGTPLTEEYLNQHRGSFVDVKSEGAPNTNFALRVPEDISFIVPTSWAELTVNKPGIDNGHGGMLVCRPDKFGRPDLNDVWVVNGKIFETTYDRTNDPTRDWPWVNGNTEKDAENMSVQASDPNTIRVKNKDGGITELKFELHSYLEEPSIYDLKDKVTVTIYDKDGSCNARNFNIGDIENNTEKLRHSNFAFFDNDREFIREFGDPSGLFREIYPDLLEAMRIRRDALHDGEEIPYRLHPEIADKINRMAYGFQFTEHEIPTNTLMYKKGKNGIALAVDDKSAVLVSPEGKIIDAVGEVHAKKLKSRILDRTGIIWAKTGDQYDPRELVPCPFNEIARAMLNHIELSGSKLLEGIYGKEMAKQMRKENRKEIKQEKNTITKERSGR